MKYLPLVAAALLSLAPAAEAQTDRQDYSPAERLLFAAIAAVLAWNGVDLLVRPVRGRPRAEPRLWPAGIFGFGIGGRMYTNFGPLRVDVAMPVGRRRGESKFSVYVSIGQAF